MAIVLRYRGRIVEETDIGFVQSLIQAHPEASRRQLSEKLCKAWNWVQPNGAPCDMICRGLMLALDRGGHIQLPPVKITPHNPLLGRRRPDVADIDASLGPRPSFSVAHFGTDGSDAPARLGAHLRPHDLLSGNVHRPGALAGNLLPCSELDGVGFDDRTREGLQRSPAEPIAQTGVGLSAVEG